MFYPALLGSPNDPITRVLYNTVELSALLYTIETRIHVDYAHLVSR